MLHKLSPCFASLFDKFDFESNIKLKLIFIFTVGIIDPMQRHIAAGIKDGKSRNIDENIPITEGVISKSFGTRLNEPVEAVPSWAVPNAYEGNFEIKNLAWDDRLSNNDSEMFRDLAGKLEIGLEETLVTNAMRAEGVFNVKITHFESGSVVAHYR